jgi:hypothetical protein
LHLSRRLHSELKSATMEKGKRRARRVAAEAHVSQTYNSVCKRTFAKEIP